ncbi:MAG: CDP-2,3-bis-(O-geranylgeranyl)-sn-glycerol synthase [Methanobacteriaceae archaeon]|nr:CDP-2,3-bis-(O-geranylgeranyl)-sn-glycerol synthase [Methanobacteriaceae archaeon]
MDFINLVIYSIYFMIPAYLANGSALVLGGGLPLDFGYSDSKGRRWIGDGVTWRGLVLGGLFGGFIGAIIAYLASLGFGTFYFNIISSQITLTDNFIFQGLILGLVLGFGALIGDAIGSFIKRRINIPRGNSVPLLDQLDFVIVALLLSSLIMKLDLIMIIIILVVSVFLHLLANIFAYLIHIKDVWY